MCEMPWRGLEIDPASERKEDDQLRTIRKCRIQENPRNTIFLVDTSGPEAWLEDRIKRAGPEDEFLFFTTLADGATAELYDRILTTLGLEDLLPLPQKIE